MMAGLFFKINESLGYTNTVKTPDIPDISREFGCPICFFVN